HNDGNRLTDDSLPDRVYVKHCNSDDDPAGPCRTCDGGGSTSACIDASCSNGSQLCLYAAGGHTAERDSFRYRYSIHSGNGESRVWAEYYSAHSYCGYFILPAADTLRYRLKCLSVLEINYS